MAGALGGGAMAQTRDATAVVEEVVVTGSLIAGTAKDTALPVEVVDQVALEKRGAPTVMEVMRTMPAMGAITGESNLTTTSTMPRNGAGQSSVNLRSLGANRTLVLLNGRRMLGSATGIVDTNQVPQAAIGRIEVLKDGAAATYGTDAIAGVVNFITRKNYNEIELSADYSFIDGSEGDTNLGLVAGHTWGDLNVLVSAGYQQRTPLRFTDRDWALTDFLTNPEAGWSTSGSPGTFARVNAAGVIQGSAVPDPQCAVLGNRLEATGCRYQFTPFQNLVDPLDRYQVFAQADYDFSDTLRFHAEANYANTKFSAAQSPSIIPGAFPTGMILNAGAPAVPNRYIVPCSNPGLQDMFAKNPAFAAAIGGAGCLNAPGAPANTYVAPTAWRPLGVGGNLFTGYDKPRWGEIRAARYSAGFDGDVGESMHWNASATYSKTESTFEGLEQVINRLQLALAGFGGASCTGTTPGANGCSWFNPFSNAIQKNVVTGAVNPQYNAAVANTRALEEWIEAPTISEVTNDMLVLDANLSGKLGFFTLPGGDIAWAVGAQHRKLTYESQPGFWTDTNINRCIDSVMNRAATCVIPRGPLNLAGGTGVSVEQSVYAGFGELQLPITDSLNAQFAIRYENYGGGIGSTTNPKLALKWQVTDSIAIRGSIGTTFRAPTASDLDPTVGQVLTPIIAAGSTSKPVESSGNPNLSPEKATSGNVGVLFERGPARFSVDYWRFDFRDPIVRTDVNAAVSSVIPVSLGLANCAAPLRYLVTFDNNNACVQGVTTGANIERARRDLINGSPIKVEGIDFDASYRFDVGPGELLISGSGTWMLRYDVGPTVFEGVFMAAGYDALGYLNETRVTGALPKFKGYARADYSWGPHSLGTGVRFLASFIDDRNIFTAASPLGKKIDEQVLVDATYVLRLETWTLSATVNNLFDTDPAFVRAVPGYDTFTGDPLGRVVKLGVRKRF